ncbi:LARGE xylosyl- and glucuronyltransferase 2 [Holothuria leucospilota]|uniref:LARGE xylosyl- and glucuronyltransferase 2 n=1 Tax=Holothuria leucospilota TaxID=206669 RepID=A0A9Q1H837_HOLLE|nr:LARGE xylosyl- and glucuronyltransferase 2 [Holothuria leucospilota]
MAKQRFEWTCFLPECVIIACHGISIKSFVWIFFMFALISFVITYIHVMLVLEFNKSDGQFGFNYDYIDGPSINIDKPRHGDWPNKNLRVKIEGEAREGNNMIATKIVDTSLTEINGWWMPNARWRAEIDCKTGLSHICRKVLSVSCEASQIHSIYQFVPINPEIEIKVLLFSATSSSPGLRMDENYDKDSTIYSAIAYLKFSDSTVDHIRLDFEAGSFTEAKLKEEKVLPFGKRLESVTVVLACRGFRGVAKFHETSLMPTGTPIMDGEAHAFSCKAGQRPASFNESMQKAIIEKLIQVKPSPKGSLFEPTVSLVTQVNMDHIELLHSMLSYWKHPISAAVFVPGEGSEDEGSKKNWKKLYIQKKLSRMKFPEGSSVTAVYAQSFQDIYHQNFMRNLALSATSEDYVFLLDAGLLPSPGFLKEFQEMVHHLEDKGKDLSTIALVVPVFQMVKEMALPNSKDELKHLVTGDDPAAVSFNILC